MASDLSFVHHHHTRMFALHAGICGGAQTRMHARNIFRWRKQTHSLIRSVVHQKWFSMSVGHSTGFSLSLSTADKIERTNGEFHFPSSSAMWIQCGEFRWAILALTWAARGHSLYDFVQTNVHQQIKAVNLICWFFYTSQLISSNNNNNNIYGRCAIIFGDIFWFYPHVYDIALFVCIRSISLQRSLHTFIRTPPQNSFENDLLRLNFV